MFLACSPGVFTGVVILLELSLTFKFLSWDYKTPHAPAQFCSKPIFELYRKMWVSLSSYSTVPFRSIRPGVWPVTKWTKFWHWPVGRWRPVRSLLTWADVIRQKLVHHMASVRATHWHYCRLLQVPTDLLNCHQKNWCHSFNYTIKLFSKFHLLLNPIPRLLRIWNWADIVTFAISRPKTSWEIT